MGAPHLFTHFVNRCGRRSRPQTATPTCLSNDPVREQPQNLIAKRPGGSGGFQPTEKRNKTIPTRGLSGPRCFRLKPPKRTFVNEGRLRVSNRS